MIVYRLCRRGYAGTALDGEGARLYGGRWNPKGVRMVYAAGSLALGALESFVHFSTALLPRDYVAIAIEIPDAVAVETWEAADLPPDWMQTPAPDALAALGEAWVKSGRTAVLRVPSAVIESEYNVLVNPAHPDAHQIHARAPAPFVFDPRLVKTRRAPAKAPTPERAKPRKAGPKPAKGRTMAGRGRKP